MLPENRLAVLLQQVKQAQIDACLYHTTASSPSLYANHLCDRRHFPTEVALELTNFKDVADVKTSAGVKERIEDMDEVWQVQFSHDGTKLAAGGSYTFALVWDMRTFGVIFKLPGHSRGVGNIIWSPDDSMILTCCPDGYPRLWDATVCH